MALKILMVGGTWDDKGGKKSKIIQENYSRIAELIGRSMLPGIKSVNVLNGGFYKELSEFVNMYNLENMYDIVIWMANVPNYFEKINVKASFPKVILVTSKNNYDKRYEFQDLLAHALSKKSNLFIEITKVNNDRFAGQVFDPLGNAWSGKTTTFSSILLTAIERATYLHTITRQSTVQSPEAPVPPPDNEDTEKFYKIVREKAEVFHKLITPAKHVTRFLGNASFRCRNGFPSMRSNDGTIYVSRRNVNKVALGADEFVQVGYNKEKNIVWYRGDYKPSVDTAIQVRLYDLYPKVNYMIHSHLYLKDQTFTKRMVPCGGLEEVEEIKRVLCRVLPEKVSFVGINLVGHGSLIMTNKPEQFDKFTYIKRPSPEYVQ